MSDHFENAQPEPGLRRHLATRSLTIPAAALILLSVGALAARADHRDDDERAGARNVVYVESNEPSGNAILAYSRDHDGRLTPLPGSPFKAGGLGITPTFALGPFDSDQNLIVDRSHTFLFAVNGGSDTVAVFRIAPDGSLSHVPGSPFPSGGTNPVSVGLSGDILTVVNKSMDPGRPGQDLPDYATFRVSRHGMLTPVPHSTFFVDQNASPSQALPSPDGDLIFGADFFGGLVRSFQLERNGRLSPVAALPLPISEFPDLNTPRFPLGLAVHPTRALLYVGYVMANKVGVYRYNSAGELGFLRTVPDSGNAVCWLTVNRDGTRLYASNTGDPSVSVYDIGRDPSEPVEIQKVTLRSTGNCFQFALDPSGRFLHVVTQQSADTQDVTANAINVLSVGPDGKLTEVPSSPTRLPVRNLTRPQGVAAL
jgi:6-phosphogluconolactonase (cycloisomerase 2 family)